VSASPAVAPAARAWRKHLRGARRAHHSRSLGDTLTDLYILLWVLVVYGGVLFSAVRQHLRSSVGTAGVSGQVYWIGVAVLFATAGLVWRGALAMGPLLATPAEQTWGVSTPVDRQGWLTPRFSALVLSTGFLGTVLALLGTLLGGHVAALGWAALAGSAYGVTLAASTVAVQGDSARIRWLRPAGWLFLGVGGFTASAVVAAHYTGLTLPGPDLVSAPVLALVGLPLAVLAVTAATRALPHLNRAALSAGADVATATVSATVWLDPSVLWGVLEVRRWRRVGTVRSRSFGLGRYGRAWTLLQADLRRQLRRLGALGVWAGLALVLYAVGLVVPPAVGAARIILAYVAAGRLMGGLHALSGSPGLRRALGGSEREQRLSHLVVPALGTLLWWALTAPVGGVHLDVAELVMVAGVVGAAYRAATRPPMSYGGAVFETPMGLFPIELVLQLARGPDVLSGVLILHALAR
jgi:hypothetical protein